MKDTFVRRSINRMSTWFPVLLLSTVAMLTYWLDAQVQGGRSARTSPPEPDYFLEDFSATRFGTDGRIVQQLTAKKLVHYPEGVPTDVESPNLTDTQPGRATIRARADKAKLSPDNEHMYLTGNVVVERDARDGRGKLVVNSEYLHVQPKLEKADTDRRVTIVDASGRHVGNAMEVDNQAHTIKLRNGVAGEMPPHSVNAANASSATNK